MDDWGCGMDMPRFFRALSDPTRYRIFLLLLERHHCARSLAQALGISESAVSQHMAVPGNDGTGPHCCGGEGRMYQFL